ncbi:MAG: PQQ-dependent sugar dehydrogenase, partial [Cyanobacteria bacterium P01_F01_bin.33]
MATSSGVIALGVKELLIEENAQAAEIPIVRSESSDGIASVEYSIGNNTAFSGSDYISESTSEVVTFSPGETIKTINIPIINDTVPEGSEQFGISIGNVSGAELGIPRTAIITIQDDDSNNLEVVGFAKDKISFREGAQDAEISVVRTGSKTERASVDYLIETSEGLGSARPNDDFIPISGTLIFKPGEEEKTISIPLINDDFAEIDETVNIVLNNPIGTNLSLQSSARLLIFDDDELNPDFNSKTLTVGLTEGISFDWMSNTPYILIAERNGLVNIFDGQSLLDEPFIDISDGVNFSGQRGLLGMAVHPNFPSKPYVYLAYTYDSPNVEPDIKGPRITRLSRFSADASRDYKIALPNSEVVLFESEETGSFHAAGSIRFGQDGSLFFSHGDGSQVVNKFQPERAQLLQSIDRPYGKVFRIDPLTGEGYDDNPFYDGNPSNIRSKVYSYGLRNPFRFALHPITDEPFIGDVGWKDWEEINTGRGANFGWPYFEGGDGKLLRTPDYANDLSAQEFYNSNPQITAPVYAQSHELGAFSIILGDFYTGTTYPEIYDNALFFNDFGQPNLNALLTDEQGNPESVVPVFRNSSKYREMRLGPDSNLYFLDSSSFNMLRYNRFIINNTMIGSDSSDTLNGNTGNDYIEGNSQNDYLFGNDGNDILKGGSDNDILIGGKGHDHLFGEWEKSSSIGDDLILAGEGNDILFGQNGNDRLQGDDGNDLIHGNEGNDDLKGGNGNDTLKGGIGNDLLFGEWQGYDGSGYTSDTGDDSISGGSGNDSLFGRDGNDNLWGGSGDDVLVGNQGEDTLMGADSIDLGRGAVDQLRGDGSADRYVLGDKSNVYYDDGVTATAGIEDYALIQSFVIAENDTLQLGGMPSDYVLGVSPINGKNGTAIYLNKLDVDELIAVVEGVENLNLNEG